MLNRADSVLNRNSPCTATAKFDADAASVGIKQRLF